MSRTNSIGKFDIGADCDLTYTISTNVLISITHFNGIVRIIFGFFDSH